MRLEQHIVDTLKEWQLKIGESSTDISLFYPNDSLREYLDIANKPLPSELAVIVKDYLNNNAEYLDNVVVTPEVDDRMCIKIPPAGCKYVNRNVMASELLENILAALKLQDLDAIRNVFKEFANKNGGYVIEDKSEGHSGAVLYFNNEDIDPYVYCFEQDDFGVTYHRFARSDYDKLK